MASETKIAFGDTTGTILRVLAVLHYLADGPVEWTLTDLAKALALPRSTVHRFLQILRSQGLAEIDEQTHRYTAGNELYRMAAILSARAPYARIAKPILTNIVAQCDETAVLGLYLPEQRRMIISDRVESNKPMRYVLPLNLPRELAWGAPARAILAFLDRSVQEEIVAQRGVSPSGEPIAARALRDELAAIRRQGYAFSHGQHTPTAIGIAAPFFAATGDVVGVIGVTLPDSRFEKRMRAPIVALVLESAAKMSKAIGGSFPARDE
jgi:DNA-binding IclR family transcriptional regulator